MCQLSAGVLQATWAQEGLQSDALSMENGAIMMAASRWSIMIDPQLQGLKWTLSREEKNGLHVVQQSQPKYIDQVDHRYFACTAEVSFAA